VLGIAEGVGRPALGGEHVDGPAAVDSLLIRRPPRALRDIDHTGQDAIRQSARQDRRAAIVENLHAITVDDAARRRIERIDEDALRKCLFQPVDPGECRVRPGQRVVRDELQRKAACFRAEGAFPLLDVLGDGRDFVRSIQVVELLGEDFDLTGRASIAYFTSVAAVILGILSVYRLMKK